MAQATLSCRCAAIHLETPRLGFFRNYLPSRFQQFPLFRQAQRPQAVCLRPFFLFVQLQYRQECLCRYLYRTQAPHPLLARPAKSSIWRGPLHKTQPGRQSPPGSRFFRFASKRLAPLARRLASARRGQVTRPASTLPGMPLSVPLPNPGSASASCPLFAFPAASFSG